MLLYHPELSSFLQTGNSIYFVDRFHFSNQEAGTIMQDHSLIPTQLSNGFSISAVVNGKR